MLSEGIARTVATALSPAGGRGRLAVFCYHQVLDEKDPLRPGEPDKAEFESDVRRLRKMFTVLPLCEAVSRLAERKMPARAACITFDDGYENNHRLAAPILRSAKVPATVFVAGDAVDRGVMWNDLIIETIAKRGSRCVFDALQLPDSLSPPEGSGPELVANILGYLKYLPLDERWTIAEQFYRSNINSELPRLMMTREMVAELASDGFDIGGHTINHPILTELSPSEANSEVVNCAAWVRRVTGQVPVSFAYPNGAPGRDFGPEHEAMVQRAGFEFAVSTEWSVAKPGANPYSIPRIGPWWRQGRGFTSGVARTYGKSYLRN